MAPCPRPSTLLVLAVVLATGAGSATASPADSIEQLGKLMYQDLDFSANGTQSCKTCHHPSAGFADPGNFRDPFNSFVSVGDDGVSTGTRNAPTTAYAGFSPQLSWTLDDGVRAYRGGLFWDGRAHGHALDDPLAEQAQGPPLNPLEMGMPDAEAIVQAVRDSAYADLFLVVFGPGTLDEVGPAFERVGRAVAAFERGGIVTRFDSRFDKYRARQAAATGGANLLNARQRRGYDLFLGKGGCASCHVADATADVAPLFTDFRYVNLGIPANPGLGDLPPDLGLGGFLRIDLESDAPVFADAAYALQDGKFRVPTLRNVTLTAPYGHNGVFPTLREVIAFHSTRDVGDWDPPDVPANVTGEVGDLGLTEDEITDLIAFLYALAD